MAPERHPAALERRRLAGGLDAAPLLDPADTDALGAMEELDAEAGAATGCAGA